MERGSDVKAPTRAKLIQARLEALNRIFNILKQEYQFYNDKHRIKSSITNQTILQDEPFKLLYQKFTLSLESPSSLKNSKINNNNTKNHNNIMPSNNTGNSTPSNPDKFRISAPAQRNANNIPNSSQFSSPDTNSPNLQSFPKNNSPLAAKSSPLTRAKVFDLDMNNHNSQNAQITSPHLSNSYLSNSYLSNPQSGA